MALSMASTPKLIVQDQTRYYALASLCLIAAKLPEKVPQQHFMHGSKKFAATESGQRLLSLAKACETRNFTEVDSLLKKKRINQLVPAVPSGADGGVNIMPQVMPILDCIRFEYGTYTAGKEKSGRSVTTATDSAHYHDPFSDKGKGKQRAERAPSVSGVSLAGSGHLTPESATASLLAAHRATPLSAAAQSMYRVASPDPSMMASRINLAPPLPPTGAAYPSLPTPPPPGSFPGAVSNVSRSATGSSGGALPYAPSTLSGASGGYTTAQGAYAPSLYPPSVPEGGVPPVPGYEQIYEHVPADFAPPPPSDSAPGSLAASPHAPAALAPAPRPAPAANTMSSLDSAPLPVPPPPRGLNAASVSASTANPLPPTPRTPSLPVPSHSPMSTSGAPPAPGAAASSAAPVTPAQGLGDDPAPPPAYAPPSKGSRFSNFLRSKN